MQLVGNCYKRQVVELCLRVFGHKCWPRMLLLFVIATLGPEYVKEQWSLPEDDLMGLTPR